MLAERDQRWACAGLDGCLEFSFAAVQRRSRVALRGATGWLEHKDHCDVRCRRRESKKGNHQQPYGGTLKLPPGAVVGRMSFLEAPLREAPGCDPQFDLNTVKTDLFHERLLDTGADLIDWQRLGSCAASLTKLRAPSLSALDWCHTPSTLFAASLDRALPTPLVHLFWHMRHPPRKASK